MRTLRPLLVLLVLIPFIGVRPLCAQQTQEQLAQQYYSNGEFAQAVEIYEALYHRAPNKYYYQMLFRSYLELGEYREADRLVEKRVKQYPRDLYLSVDQGYVFERKGDLKKSVKLYDAAVERVGVDARQVEDLVRAFEGYNHPEYAVKVYLLARKRMRNEFVYVSELATLYQRQGDFEAMMQEYFNLLDNSPGSMGSIQIALQRALRETANPQLAEGLKRTLVQRVQDHPDNRTYLDMMIWFSLQQKDFRFAMAQAKAVDARFPDLGGEQLMRVAQIAQSNEEYDVAAQCYAALVKKGAQSPYYFQSRVGELQVKFDRVNRNLPLEYAALNQLRTDYLKAFDELGKNTNTVQLMRNYSQLMAYYMDSVQPAADILYDVLDMPRVDAHTRDEVKLELGDLLLFAGEVWDASLLYMQVEKANKNDVTGSQAKFRNAKLSYFNHDFAWAQSQLEVLRASTSKLIANDAMELSLLISDNMEEDSTYTMLELYATADLLLYRNLLDSAWNAFEAVNIRTLSHPLLDEVLLQQAKIRMRQQRYAEADSLLQKLVDFYPDDILADDGLMLLAQLNEERLGNPDRARECYEKLILDYPASLFADQARKRYNSLKAK